VRLWGLGALSRLKCSRLLCPFTVAERSHFVGRQERRPLITSIACAVRRFQPTSRLIANQARLTAAPASGAPMVVTYREANTKW
jgi:hypothetical protein